MQLPQRDFKIRKQFLHANDIFLLDNVTAETSLQFCTNFHDDNRIKHNGTCIWVGRNAVIQPYFKDSKLFILKYY